MRRFPRLGRFWWKATILLAGGGVFVLDSCDPTIKTTILGGLESASSGLATTFITALFQKLSAEDQSTTTTLLRTLEEAARMLA